MGEQQFERGTIGDRSEEWRECEFQLRNKVLDAYLEMRKITIFRDMPLHEQNEAASCAILCALMVIMLDRVKPEHEGTIERYVTQSVQFAAMQAKTILADVRRSK